MKSYLGRLDEERQAIIDVWHATPGLTLRGLSRLTGLPLSNLAVWRRELHDPVCGCGGGLPPAEQERLVIASLSKEV